ncbi:hypothetical protein FRC02_012087 [Tulasnella sp. 418]|nr:hypothetical protein FRC02_012087 [Tulasnella sp. 418]
MYCLGGRSAAWGLFSPRIHDSTLKNRFPKNVNEALWSKWYTKAEKLFMLSLPQTGTIHRHTMERLNMAAQQLSLSLDVQWQWGRIASEFRDERNFDFAEGAYSTIDKLLEIAMSKPKIREVVSDDGKTKVTRDLELEHENFKILINAEAHRLKVNKSTKKFEGVYVRDASGEEYLIEGKEVVLAAGSVESPTILLRSELNLPNSVGKITDHDILYWTAPFRYTRPGRREEVGSMKLQTYVNLGGGHVALGNMSVDASSFLPRGESPDEDMPKFIMVFILQNPLVQDSSITLDENGKPIVKIVRYIHDEERSQLVRMQELTFASIRSMKETLGLEFVGEPGDAKDIGFKYLELGGVAHELGTLPMPNKNKDNAYCVDEDLKLAGGYEGIYVCDLSVFPYSPEANPTLTLAALSLRLSRYLTRDTYFEKKDNETVSVVNRTGKKLQVWLSNRSNAPNDERGYTIMGPGDLKEWKRVHGKPESLFVFKPDQTSKEGEEKYLAEPELLVAHPGVVTAIY